MKRFFLLIAVLVVLSSTCFAEVYQNRDYNFQLELPNGWIDNDVNPLEEYLFNKGVHYQIDGKNYAAGMGLKSWSGGEILDKKDFSNMSVIEQKNIFRQVTAGIKESYPTFEITYSGISKMGENTVGIIKGGIKESPIRIFFVLSIVDGNRYLFSFVTNDPNSNREPEFIEMIKSLKPIY